MADKDNRTKSIPDRVIRIELISYFSTYPETVATSEETALLLQRDPEQVEGQMEDLVQLHILAKSRGEERTLYSYLAPLSCCLMPKKNSTQNLRRRFSEPRAGVDVHQAETNEGSNEEEEKEGETAVRMQLMISALKRKGWRECLELLLDVLYRSEGAPCAAYLLVDRCSEMLWDFQRGANGTKIGMTKVAEVQNMVIEGDLIRKKGLLDTVQHIKYLYPLGEDEDVLICVYRNGSYQVSTDFLTSLCVDILPVVAEKRRLELMEEMSAEKILQDSIYWDTLQGVDVGKGLAKALASIAKSVDAERVSLLVEDGSGSLRTLSIYGLPQQPDIAGHEFSKGEGIVGWCVERGEGANLTDARADPRFISSEYNDIDSLLCCPLLPPDGGAIGAICAVNKQQPESNHMNRFDDKDVRLIEGIAKTLVNAFSARENRTRLLPRKMINAALAAQSF